MWGIDWQLPSALYFDEHKYYGWAAAVTDGRPPARTDFRNPSLFRHLLRAEYAASHGILAQDEPEVRAIRRMLLARVTTAILGALAAVFVALTATMLFSTGAGVSAGLLMAMSPLHVHLSHIAVNDVAASFFLSAGLLAGARILGAPTLRWVLAAGIAAGLAAAAKYNFGVVLILPVVSLVIHAWQGRLPFARALALLSICGVSFAIGLVGAMPEIALTPREVLDGMREQARIGGIAPEEQPDTPVAILYVETLLRGLGLPGLVMALVGFVVVARGRMSVALALVICPVIYYLVMLRNDFFAARFALPLVPFAAVLAGSGISALSRWSRAPWGSRVTLAALLVLVCVPLVRDVVHHNTLAMVTDTRLLAGDWVAANARGTRIAAQTYSLPPVWAGRRAIDGVRVDRFQSLMSPELMNRYLCNRVRYVLLSSFMYERHYGKAPGVTGYDVLIQHAQRVATFSPYKPDQKAPTHPDDTAIPFWHMHAYERPGPRIDVYRVPDEAYQGCTNRTTGSP